MAFGECGGAKEDINNWGGDGFPATVCCRNTLTDLSDAMAVQARNSTAGQLFVSHDQWQSCGDSFHPQQGMSLSSCGFDSLYFGSSKCSSVVLQDVRSMDQYQDALSKCSHFDHPYNEACADCSEAILSLRDSLYASEMGKDNNNDTERVICGVAALVAVAADKSDDPSLPDKFLRCLPAPGAKKTTSKTLKLTIACSVLLEI